MKPAPDLLLDLPFSDEAPLPPPRLDNDRYLEFIESNLRLIRENGTAERILRQRARPVDEPFVLP